MIFSAPFLIHSLRWIPPAASLLGSAATYMTAWTLLQCASLVLPARAASRLERSLYSSYQAMVGFWFETWSGVEVGGARGGANCTGMFIFSLPSVLFLWRQAS